MQGFCEAFERQREGRLGRGVAAGVAGTGHGGTTWPLHADRPRPAQRPSAPGPQQSLVLQTGVAPPAVQPSSLAPAHDRDVGAVAFMDPAPEPFSGALALAALTSDTVLSRILSRLDARAREYLRSASTDLRDAVSSGG
jgi:hypothetical protein